MKSDYCADGELGFGDRKFLNVGLAGVTSPMIHPRLIPTRKEETLVENAKSIME
jgi:hypothetical protein